MDWLTLNSCTCACTCLSCVYRFDVFFVLLFIYLIYLNQNSDTICVQLPLLPVSSKVPFNVSFNQVSIKCNNNLVKRKLIKPNIDLNLDTTDDEEDFNKDDNKSYINSEYLIQESNLLENQYYEAPKSSNSEEDKGYSSMSSNDEGIGQESILPYVVQAIEMDDYVYHQWVSFKELKQIRKILIRDDLFNSIGFLTGLKEDLIKGRTCKACLKTRLRYFGPFSIKCKLCERLVCLKCTSYVQILNSTKIPICLLVSNGATSLWYSFNNRFRPLSFNCNLNLNQCSDLLMQSENLGLRRNLGRSVSLKKLFKPNTSSEVFNMIRLCTDCQIFYHNIVSPK